tara:strand:- start:387 stop:575 length:189 start_codon:yes stop_codon:yes gene_type:complete
MKKITWLLSLPPMRQFGEYLKNYFTKEIGMLPFSKKVKSIKEKAQIMNAAWDLMHNDIKVEE